MSVLFVDDTNNPFAAEDDKQRDTYKAEIDAAIENKYKGNDSEYVYSLFTEEQRKLLVQFYRAFSVDMYRELNGTVDIQIKKQTAEIKKKIDNIGKSLGRKINLEEWQYDGMLDYGKGEKQKCDLCQKVSLQCVHFIVNKKTKDTLQFGCTCAGKFLCLEDASLSSMKTIQANALKDLKMLAFVLDTKTFKQYNEYLCGYIGKVINSEGIVGIKNLLTFNVEWISPTEINGNKEKDEYVVLFTDNTKELRPLSWIKENIAVCLNADLDSNYHLPLENRKLEKLAILKDTKRLTNTTAYVKVALQFLYNKLPLPLSLARKINRVLGALAKTHHLDYLKYTEELLMSEILNNSTLLRAAFTDFIVSYLTNAANKSIEKSPEMEYWGIRGVKTFYNTVLKWEAVLMKTQIIKRVVNFERLNYIDISSIKLDNRLYTRNTVTEFLEYMNRCCKLLITKKAVNKVESNLDKGYSQYEVVGVEDKLKVESAFDKEMLSLTELSVQMIPRDINYFYFSIISFLHNSVLRDITWLNNIFFKPIYLIKDDRKLIRYLLGFRRTFASGRIQTKVNPYNIMSLQYIKDEKGVESLLGRDFKSIDEELIDTYYTKYKDILPTFREAVHQLSKKLHELVEKMKEVKAFKDISRTDKLTDKKLGSDFEELVHKKEDEKTTIDYYEEYAKMFENRRNRGTQKVMKLFNNFQRDPSLEILSCYKDLSEFSDMISDIIDDDKAEKSLKAYEKEKEKAEQQKRLEQQKREEEERKRQEEERKRQEEIKRKQQEEEQKRIEEEKRKQEERAKLPEEERKKLEFEDKVKELEQYGRADATGYNDIQKAYICSEHEVYITLKQIQKDVIQTVLKTKRCSMPQSYHINNAYKELLVLEEALKRVHSELDKKEAEKETEKGKHTVEDKKENKQLIDLMTQIKSHTDFGTLSEIEQKIVGTVSRTGRVSDKQLSYIKKACKTLNIDAKLEGIDVSSASTEMSSDIIELVDKIIEHKDFKTLTDIEQGIIKTVKKTGKVSSKQMYYIKSAKKKLGV